MIKRRKIEKRSILSDEQLVELCSTLQGLTSIHTNATYAEMHDVLGDAYAMFFNMYGRTEVERYATSWMLGNQAAATSCECMGVVAEFYDDDRVYLWVDHVTWRPAPMDFCWLFVNFITNAVNIHNIVDARGLDAVMRYAAVHFYNETFMRVIVDVAGL